MAKSCKTLVKALVKIALEDDMVVSVNDGEAWPVKRSKNLAEIMSSLEATDEELLIFRDAETNAKLGWVQLIWGGMEGTEVFADYSENDVIQYMIDVVEMSNGYV